MEAKNKQMVLYAASAVILIGVVIYRLLGTQGKGVLISAALFGLAVIFLGGLLSWLILGDWKQQHNISTALSLMTAMLLLVYGAFTEIKIAKDLNVGTATATLDDCEVASKTGVHGILSSHYYLKGTDHEGKVMSFPISGAAREKLDGQTTVTVEYYKNIGRIVSCK